MCRYTFRLLERVDLWTTLLCTVTADWAVSWAARWIEASQAGQRTFQNAPGVVGVGGGGAECRVVEQGLVFLLFFFLLLRLFPSGEGLAARRQRGQWLLQSLNLSLPSCPWLG